MPKLTHQKALEEMHCMHAITFFEGKDIVVRLWSRKGKTVKKWRARAWSIDPKKTKLTIIIDEKLARHIPPWICKKHFASQIVCG